MEQEIKRVQKEIDEADEALELKSLLPSAPAPLETPSTPLGDLNDTDALRRLIYGGVLSPASDGEYGAVPQGTSMVIAGVERMLDMMVLDNGAMNGAAVHHNQLEHMQALLATAQADSDTATLSLRQHLHTKKLERDRVARERDEVARACDETKRRLAHSSSYRGVAPGRVHPIKGEDAPDWDCDAPEAADAPDWDWDAPEDDLNLQTAAMGGRGAMPENDTSLSDMLLAHEAEEKQKSVLAVQPERLRRANSILQNALELESMDLQYMDLEYV